MTHRTRFVQAPCASESEELGIYLRTRITVSDIFFVCVKVNEIELTTKQVS